MNASAVCGVVTRVGWLVVGLACACGGPAAQSGGGGPGAGDAGGSGGGVSGGSGAGGACDPSEPTFDAPDVAPPSAVMHAEIAPAAIDEATFAYPQSKHQLYIADPTEVPPREELFVLLPGTNNLAQGFDTLARLAASAGYPVIVLAYESDTHPAGLCAAVTGAQAIADCRTGVMAEKAYGNDVTDAYPGDEPNSVAGRLVRVLAHVDQNFPAAGADRFYDDAGPRWDRIVLAGFSQGSVLAGFIGKDQALARLVLLAGGCDATGEAGSEDRELLPWCFEPRATPAARTWALSHVNDLANADRLSHEAFGLLEIADYADASTEAPSYCTQTHALMSNEPTPKAHLSVALDAEIPVDASGVPVLAEDYLYLFTAE